jgi:hypothetical protein
MTTKNRRPSIAVRAAFYLSVFRLLSGSAK